MRPKFNTKKHITLYKIIVLDIDGTLTNSKKDLSPRNRKAIIDLQERGYVVVLASGRPVYGIMPLAEELELAKYGGYILAFNGAQIIKCATDKVIYSNTLPNELIRPLYEKSKAAGAVILSYNDDYILTENASDKYVAYEGMLNKMQIRQTDNFLENLKLPVVKCLSVAEPDIILKLENDLKAEYGEVMSIYRSEAFFLELVPNGIDKAESLAVLLNHLNLNRKDMIAFGDGFNDLTMLEYAGCGVAMGNAKDAVKEVADAVTISNDEDGVAHYIEEFLM